VAIEIPRGAVVESLAERGIHVYAINPKQLDRFRDRHTIAGAKDDRRDAFVLADSLRTDRECFRRVQVADPIVIQIREVTRVDEDLRAEMNALANRLREQLHRFYPQMLSLCPSVDQPWFWHLVEMVPTPKVAIRLRARRIEDLLKAHRVRRLAAKDVLAVLRESPLQLAPGTVDASASHIAKLLPRLRLVYDQRNECEAQLEVLLGSLPGPPGKRDIDIIRSMPGIGVRVAGTLLAEASEALAERDYKALRAHGGVAPVTHQTGQRRTVSMRHACSVR
jgi:transposase